MRGAAQGPALECVLIDLNTQEDFLNPQGACPVANLEELIPTLRRLVAWVKRNQASVVSSVDSHRVRELFTESGPVHCLDGSGGQKKIGFTVFPRHTRIEFDNTLSIPLDLFLAHQQVIFRKREEDLLGNPKADRFLTQLRAKEYIIFGTGLESAIKLLALGLLIRHKRVTVISDGCGYWDKGKADLALRQMQAKGTIVVTVEEFLKRRLKRPRRYSNRISTDQPPRKGGLSPTLRSGERASGGGNGRPRRKHRRNGRASPQGQQNRERPTDKG